MPEPPNATTTCRHCEASIRLLAAEDIAGMGADADGRDPQPGDWADLVTGIDCPGTDDRRHEPVPTAR